MRPISASEGFQVMLRECIRRETAGRRRSVRYAPLRWAPALGVAAILIVAGVWLVDSGVFHGSDAGPQTAESRSVIDGRVQYVMDEYPRTVSIARSDDPKPRDATTDSLSVYISKPSSPV